MVIISNVKLQNYIEIIIIFVIILNLEKCQINDNYYTNILETGNNDLLDVTDYHNMNLIVSTSKNIYIGIPPLLKTTTNANLISVSSLITINNEFLLAACLQDSLLTKIKLSNGESTSILGYSDILINPSLTVPETTCSLSNIDNTVFIGYTKINQLGTTETNKTNIIIKVGILNKNSENDGPNLDTNENIVNFKFQSTIKTKSMRQISCEPLKISNNNNNYRLVCLHETTGYYQNTLEYFVYATSINKDFNNFESNMYEYKVSYAYEDSGIRIYKVNDTYARCQMTSTLAGIKLEVSSDNKLQIKKVYESSNIYSYSSDLDLFNYSNDLRFSAEKVNFMNRNNIYYFQINKATSSNYLKLYDYKETIIKRILGYYDKKNDYIILIYQTEDNIKYFTLKNTQNIYNIDTYSGNIQIKTYEHKEYNMNDLITGISDLGNLNIEFITKNISSSISTEKYGTDFYELYMNDNIFIPEKSMKTWYRYNFSLIEHEESNYTRIYYLRYISIIVQTCHSFSCKSCWNSYNQCDICTNNNNYALLVDDDSQCFPKDLLIKGYIYKESTNKFEKCYSSCDFCSESSTDSSKHKCESCKEGYLFSYEKLGNCYDINNLEIDSSKKASYNKFISTTCDNLKIISNGECIDNCPNANTYYNFEYNVNSATYIKTIINSPKYLFNKKCYEECPPDLITDETELKCKCQYAFHIDNEELTCYSDFNCIPNYPYKNLDTNQCYSSLNECYYFFNNDCYNICPNGKTPLNSEEEIIQNYFINELFLDNILKNKLCICNREKVWIKINSTSEIFFQKCLDNCPEGYEPEQITNQCIIKKELLTTIITKEPISTIISTHLLLPFLKLNQLLQLSNQYLYQQLLQKTLSQHRL